MRKTHQGKYRPRNPRKYRGDINEIVYRSSWELKLMSWCDRNTSVKKWNSEGVVIPYFDPVRRKRRRYFVDFLIQVEDVNGIEKTYLIEVKPRRETMPPRRKNLREERTFLTNSAKWKAAQKWCDKKGIEFRIMTERDLGI